EHRDATVGHRRVSWPLRRPSGSSGGVVGVDGERNPSSARTQGAPISGISGRPRTQQCDGLQPPEPGERRLTIHWRRRMGGTAAVRGGRTILTAPVASVALVAIGAALWGTDGAFRQPLVAFPARWSPYTIVLYEHVILTAVVAP